MLRLAGAIGDGLIVNLFPVTALPQILGAWRAGAAEAGRDVSGQEVVCRFQVCVTDDVPRARAARARGLRRLRRDAGLQPLLRWCGFEDVAKAVGEAFARGDRAAVAAAMSDDVRRPDRDPRQRRALPRADRRLRRGGRHDAGDRAPRPRPRRGRARARGLRPRAGRELSPAWRRPVLVSGASGLVGSALLAALRARGERRARADPRRRPGSGRIRASRRSVWDGLDVPEAALARGARGRAPRGRAVFGGLPTAARRERIYASRVAFDPPPGRGPRAGSPRRSARASSSAPRRSATTATAARSSSTRTSAPGAGFLAGVCVDWEGEAAARRSPRAAPRLAALRGRALAARRRARPPRADLPASASAGASGRAASGCRGSISTTPSASRCAPSTTAASPAP